MASFVLSAKDKKKYSCGDCMDGSNFIAQGRTKEWADDRIKRRLISKGCINDAKTPVLRLNDGGKVYRCPRSISDRYDTISHFMEVAEIQDGTIKYNLEAKPWKWSAVRDNVQTQIKKIRELQAENNK